MNNDEFIKHEGMKVLSDKLGIVNAERFIFLILRDKFDYTKWQQNMYENVSLEDFLKNADEYRQTNKK